jgi:tRNA G18 (ribose-2'-O)-methylase SpoU
MQTSFLVLDHFMPILHYLFYQCPNPTCGLRFPAQVGSLPVEQCPRCKEALEKSGSLEIVQETDDHPQIPDGYVIEALLDNIRSAWNVGSMFRTADGTGIRSLYLCGITPTPAHPQVVRTALGAESSIAWQYYSNALILAKSLITTGRKLWVLEDIPGSISLFDLAFEKSSQPILLVVGNEVSGVDPGLLEICERVISIPMVGLKRSYNVAVAFGIAASYLRYCQNFSQGSDRTLPST